MTKQITIFKLSILITFIILINTKYLIISIALITLFLLTREINKKRESKEVEKNSIDSTLTIRELKKIEKIETQYTMPSLDLLENSIDRVIECEDKSTELENMFACFGICIEIVNIIKARAFTRYEIKIPEGVKFQKIVGLEKNIALTLGVSIVRVVLLENSGLVGIEVASNTRRVVSLRSILENRNTKDNYNLPITLGHDVYDKPLTFDLTTAPHLLVAGSTGSGKSVCLNTIILSLIYNFSPSELNFIFIDKKKVELSLYNGIPHLLTDTITNTDDAIAGLEGLISEMNKRYTKLEKMKVRNIESYNKKAIELGKNKLPYIVLVIDELYNLISASPKEIEKLLTNLSSMSRAVGIHLIAATQRPSADVITGLIKNNFTTRIAFKVPSKINSRIILDEGGAETLLGKGDGLFQMDGMSVSRFQGAFVSEDEVERVVEFLKKI